MKTFHADVQPYFRSSHQRCFIKKGDIKNFTKINRKTPMPEPLLLKLHACKYIKKDSDTSVPSEFCKVFQSTYFIEHLRTTASVISLLFSILQQKLQHRTKPRRHLLVQNQQWKHQSNV